MSKPLSTANESCNSQSSFISSWIQQLPTVPSSFEDVHNSITVLRFGKNKVERSPTHKKRPLAEISGNAMNTTSYNLRKRKNASSPLSNQPDSVKRRQMQLIRDEGSPRKRGAPQKRDSRPNSNQGIDIFDENANDSTDPEDTPRPLSKRKRVEDDAPSMPTPLSKASASSDRSRSPTKMAELLNLPDPMHSKVLQDLQDVDEEHPLFRVRNLLTKLRAVSSGIGILDRSTKVESLNSFVGKSS